MNRDARIKKIQEILERDKENPFGKMEIPWNDRLEPKNVYLIPLEYLVYNKYNGRILSRTQSLEKQNYSIDVETPEGKELIEKLLWESNESRNKTTLASLAGGQQKVGIITKDGIIIDGNRRAMLLNRSKAFDYFKAVVLDVTLEENPLEIEKLETTYQMGEDEKVGYNPTEKYIKTKLLYKKLAQKEYSSRESLNVTEKKAIEKIGKWMGEDDNEIIKYLNTMERMDEYLDYLGYNGIYTQLDKREDHFLFLTKWLSNYYGESGKAFDGHKDTDVDDLKTISFDYIRARYEGKEFRIIGEGLKSNHFFGDEDIWKSFSKSHFEKVSQIQEQPIDYNSRDIKSHLDSRDNSFIKEATQHLTDNIDKHREKLRYKQAAGEPQKLVDKAFDAIGALKIGHSSFSAPQVQSKLGELATKLILLTTKSSIITLLEKIVSMLEGIDVNQIKESEKSAIAESTKKIQQLGYKINKSC